METKGNSRTFVMGTVAGVVVAAALGAAFLLGGQAGGSNETAEAKVIVEATPTAQGSGQTTTGAAQPATGEASESDGGSQQQDDTDEPVATETPAATDEDETPTATATETATATATATSTPTGECAYCLDGDLVLEPTPIDPCPLCGDFDLVIPVDQPPSISNISTSFCYPALVVKFDLQDADVVWFSFTSNGVTHEAQHIDADTFDGYMSKDLGYLGWGAYFVTNLRIHAKDDQGHHVWSDEIPMPEPDLSC